jgi:hypothetical protein
MTPEELKRLHDDSLKPTSPYEGVAQKGGFSFWLLTAGMLIGVLLFKKGK